MNDLQLRIQQYADIITEAENVRLTKSASTAVRRKCFISYHSADATEVIQFLADFGEIFIGKTVGVTDEDDFIDSDNTGYVMDKIRTKYLTDSTVTIALIGKCTWARRYVDWEIYSSLRNDMKNTRNGLLAVTLPSVASAVKTLPERINDNVKGENGDAGYARWWKYPKSKESLRSFIEIAFASRTTLIPDNSRTRKIRSSTCS